MSENEADFTMAFQDSCDQPALLLIHGFPLNSNMWVPQLEDLADFARVIAPDLRGHGKSTNVPGPYSMTLLADDCADLLGYLTVSAPFVVCGLSMGGYIAFEFFRRHPDYVAGLILAATRATADTDEGKADRDKMITAVQSKGLAGLADGMLPKLLASDADKELNEFVRAMIESTSVEGVIGALQGMRDRPDSTPTLAEIDVPTLIIHGADDQLISVAEAETMHRGIKDSQLVIIPRASHLPNLEQPDAFNDAVIDFLDALGLDV